MKISNAVLLTVVSVSIAFAIPQVVGPESQRLAIPVQPAGDQTLPTMQSGDLMDATGVSGGPSNAGFAVQEQKMGLDEKRDQGKTRPGVSIHGRPSHMSQWLVTLNKGMSITSRFCDAAADYIHEIATAENRLKAMGDRFQKTYTGIWNHLGMFKISDLWDIRRKWDRKFEYKINDLSWQICLLNYYMQHVSDVHNNLGDAIRAVYGNPEDRFADIRLRTGIAVDLDPEYKVLDMLDQAAAHTLIFNTKVDSILNQSNPSAMNGLQAFVGSMTFNQNFNLDAYQNMTDIEIDLSKSYLAAQNTRNSYSDYITINNKLLRQIVKLDQFIGQLNQQEALLTAMMVSLSGTKVRKVSEQKNAVYVSFDNIDNGFSSGD